MAEFLPKLPCRKFILRKREKIPTVPCLKQTKAVSRNHCNNFPCTAQYRRVLSEQGHTLDSFCEYSNKFSRATQRNVGQSLWKSLVTPHRTSRSLLARELTCVNDGWPGFHIHSTSCLSGLEQPHQGLGCEDAGGFADLQR